MPSDLGTESLGPPGLPKQARERPHTGGGLPEPQLPSASRSRPPFGSLEPAGSMVLEGNRKCFGNCLHGAIIATQPACRKVCLVPANQ